uniref:Uncharacterized protein n=1 Tax=Arundo donax TaxID=35708 RepID=A0A0A9GR14_ARUDO
MVLSRAPQSRIQPKP